MSCMLSEVNAILVVVSAMAQAQTSQAEAQLFDLSAEQSTRYRMTIQLTPSENAIRIFCDAEVH